MTPETTAGTAAVTFSLLFTPEMYTGVTTQPGFQEKNKTALVT